MALPNAYAQYNNSKVLTASPAELTLMLYEGAIKFCNIAEVAIEEKDVEKAHNNIRKVQNIIGYLQCDKHFSHCPVPQSNPGSQHRNH